jgi:hypothetical protein
MSMYGLYPPKQTSSSSSASSAPSSLPSSVSSAASSSNSDYQNLLQLEKFEIEQYHQVSTLFHHVVMFLYNGSIG